jgi:hypothetical protein
LEAISADISHYRENEPLDFGGRFGLKLKREFAVNDLFQGDVGIGHPRSYFDERAMTHRQLPYAFGYEIHQQSGVGNDFRRFLKKLAGHSWLTLARQNADGTGRRNVGRERRFVKWF